MAKRYARSKDRDGKEGKRVERKRGNRGELFRRAVDTIRDSLHGHCTPFKRRTMAGKGVS